MKLRALLVSFTVFLWVGCQCGPGATGLCDGVKCDVGLRCDGNTGRCVTGGGGSGGSTGGSGGSTGGTGGTGGSTGGSGGGGAGQCAPACTGSTPVCEPLASGGGRCVTCTAFEGCTGATPYCDPSAGAAGTCYECVVTGDCPTWGTHCDSASHTCVPDGTGGGAGGGSSTVTWDDAGMTVHCLGSDAGPAPCTTTCREGFQCVNGACVLNGSTGAVQVTLRFPLDEDLDLHVVEPLLDGGSCEIYYGAPNSPPDAGYLPFPCGSLPHCGPNQICYNNACVNLPVSSCGALGWLDLDSNPACNIDSVDIENYIWPGNQPATRGLYTVRVDYYQHCSASGSVPYEVEVRANGATRYYCGTFQPGDADNGNAGSGRTITTVLVQ